MQVPGSWENQGYNNYDGYAVYTKKLKVTKELASQRLVLLAGRIDDADMVFINGNFVGQTGDYSGRSSNEMHTEFRNYFIPPGIFKVGEENVVEIRVYDSGGEGGICEGKVGLMVQEQFRAWWRSQRKN
jgi:sialate O-acetylesterase